MMAAVQSLVTKSPCCLACQGVAACRCSTSNSTCNSIDNCSLFACGLDSYLLAVLAAPIIVSRLWSCCWT